MVTSNVVEFAGKARMPRLGMGTMALSIEGRPDRATAIGTIHAALDAGVVGVPSVFAGDRVFWGDDQLELAADYAASVAPGA